VKITINLATRPYADQGPALKRLRIGMAVLAVLLAGLGWGLFHFHNQAMAMRAQQDGLDRQIAAIQKEELGYQAQMQLPDNATVLKQAVFLNGLFDEKAFSWTAAMEDLERVMPAGVQVTAIQPERGKDGRLTLRLKVAGLRERSVEMLRNMEHSRRFLSPRVAGESAENSSAQGQVQAVSTTGKVIFDVLAEYNPATPEERQAEIAAQRRKKAVDAAPVPLQPAPGRIRPQYIPPSPQPRPPQRQGMNLNRLPGGPPNGAVNSGRTVAPSGAVYVNGIPTGYDANGLKNHSRNQLPPGSPQPPDDPGGPQ
jgi:type IV pilus assembly protein PilN